MTATHPSGAFWAVPTTDYTPDGVRPDAGLLDDGDRLDAAWRATVNTLRREACEDPATRAEVARRAGQINQRLRERAEQRKEQR